MSQAKEMQDLIHRWEGSGLPQRAFAQQEGVSYRYPSGHPIPTAA
jgi:hypothetical protein